MNTSGRGGREILQLRNKCKQSAFKIIILFCLPNRLVEAYWRWGRSVLHGVCLGLERVGGRERPKAQWGRGKDDVASRRLSGGPSS
jgi:hypothetical protein